jgi:methyltransferase (TIGR00027 family)
MLVGHFWPQLLMLEEDRYRPLPGDMGYPHPKLKRPGSTLPQRSCDASYHPDVEGVAATALLTAASRARESARSDALFVDPWADLLAGSAGREFLERHEEVLTATTPIFVVRHRFFDDFLAGAARRGIQQIVLIAAGLDTRAYRLVWPTGTHIYELDQPQVLAYKQEVLDRAGATPECVRVPVAADLRDDWPAILLAAGLRPDEPTAWLAEGLLFYLPETGARTLLTTMASLSAPDSVLGTDTMSATMLASEERRAWVSLYADSGAPFVFGTDDPEGFATSCGWNPIIHLGRDLGTDYGRPFSEPQESGLPPGAIITATLT